MTNPCDLTAVSARRLIGSRRLSPVELLDSCIEQIERINPSVNAVTATAYERARTEAKAAETAVMRGDALGPLHGLPLGIKDLNDTEGLLTTLGSPLYKDRIPEKDESVVANLRQAGAIVFCKTNVPIFGAGANTTNPVWGVTRNPFDTDRICGGSSGGSAVALACDMMPIATGSDSGGSLRIPAAFCGVVSHRGTVGLVPTEKHAHGYTVNGVQGPMARNVEDMNLMLSVMARYDARQDPMSYPSAPDGFDGVETVDLSSLRVAVTEDLGATDVDDGIRQTFRQRVDAMATTFKRCDVATPDFSNVRDCYWTLRSFQFVTRFRELYENHRDDIGPNVAMNYESGLQIDMKTIAWATAEQTNIYRRVQAFFDDYDVLICPTVAVPPFPVEQLYCEEINGKKLERYLDWLALTWITTTPGNPVTNLPCGLDHTGTPFGLQIIGPMHQDRRIIGIAKALEAHFALSPATARPVPDLSTLENSR
ncbi:MAG: amidase [Gammaproteobacteria bacterium]|nr:amidase [Gammaproteobacteria bacterium]